MPSCRRSNSSSFEIFPVRSRHEFTPDCAASMRSTSCCELISSEKKPTGVWCLIAVCRAMSSASVVFPIDGRAASMTRSDFWRPESMVSRAGKPVGTPRMAPVCFCRLSRRSHASVSSSLIAVKLRIDELLEIANTACCASSKTCSISRSSAKPSSPIFDAASMSARCMYFVWTTSA